MICLVTDRRRLAGEDAPLAFARRCLAAQAGHAVDAGIDLIQLREPDLEAADLATLARDLLQVLRGSTTRLVVNDRLDVAIVCGASGVHLRGGSIPVAAARRIAPRGFLVGRSVHTVDEAAEAAGADYLIAGTVFESASKPAEHELLGLGGLRAITSSTSAQVLAIGGVVPDSCDAIAAAGAAGVAAIGMFLADEVAAKADPARRCRTTPLRDAVERARSRFDSVQSAP